MIVNNDFQIAYNIYKEHKWDHSIVRSDSHTIKNKDTNTVINPNITKLFVYCYELPYYDFQLYPNVEFIYLYNNYTKKLININPNIKYIFLKLCNNTLIPYIKNLKVLYYVSSMGTTAALLTDDYHKKQDENYDWHTDPALQNWDPELHKPLSTQWWNNPNLSYTK